MKEIADRIRIIRTQRGMTQQDLADAMGYKSRSAICHIESDDYEISLETVKRIASALRVDPDYLIFGEENAKEEIKRLFDLLPDDKQEAVLVFLRSMLGK